MLKTQSFFAVLQWQLIKNCELLFQIPLFTFTIFCTMNILVEKHSDIYQCCYSDLKQAHYLAIRQRLLSVDSLQSDEFPTYQLTLSDFFKKSVNKIHFEGLKERTWILDWKNLNLMYTFNEYQLKSILTIYYFCYTIFYFILNLV